MTTQVEVSNTITITTEPGAAVILERKTGFTADMIKVTGSGDLTLQAGTGGSLTLDGGHVEAAGSLIRVDSGNLTMNTGVTLRNNKNSADGGGVYFAGTSFDMDGGTLSGNQATSGGGVYVASGTFTKSGGIIYGDTDTNHTSGSDENTAASGNGHAVYVYDSPNPLTRDNTAGTGIMLASATPGPLGGWDGFIFTSAAIQEAIDGLPSGEPLVLPAGTYDMEAPTVEVSDNITITTKPGAAVILMRNSTFSGDMIKVTDGSLTLQAAGTGSLSLDGDEVTASGSLVRVESGDLIMEDGVTLQNNKNSGNGGGVYVAGGTFTMNGGTINDNEAAAAGGVYFAGTTFTMDSGIISGNTATSTGSTGNGGGVYVDGGEFKLNGGTISGNKANGNGSTTQGGGGVYFNGTIFNMTGGTIGAETATDANTDANTAVNRGGGVHMAAGTFAMSGGIISCNHANGYGGGVAVNNTGFTMSENAVIRGNTTNGSGLGGGVSVSNSGTFNMSGGTVSGNTAGMGGGVYVGGSFGKTSGGTIYGKVKENGTTEDSDLQNTASSDNYGHAVFVNSGSKKRNTTAGPTVNLNSTWTSGWDP
jgi:hypothetical protein